MNDAALVGGVQSVGDLQCQAQQLLGWQGVFTHVVLQRPAFHQLHHDELLAVVLADVEDGADRRMIQRAGETGFTSEPLDGACLLEERWRQEFDGDPAAEPRVFGAIDDAHAAAAELVEDAVVPNAATRLAVHGAALPDYTIDRLDRLGCSQAPLAQDTKPV